MSKTLKNSKLIFKEIESLMMQLIFFLCFINFNFKFIWTYLILTPFNEFFLNVKLISSTYQNECKIISDVFMQPNNYVTLSNYGEIT